MRENSYVILYHVLDRDTEFWKDSFTHSLNQKTFIEGLLNNECYSRPWGDSSENIDESP